MYEGVQSPVRTHEDALVAPDFAARGTLAGSALWLLASNLVYAVCQWATVVALARLGATSLGYFGVALAVATPVVLLTGFSLRAYQATDVLRRYPFADYLALRLVANVVAGGVIAAVALAAVDKAAAVILIPLGAAKLAEATSETCYGLAQRHDRMRFVALSKVVRGGLGLAALVTVVALGGSVANGTWALAAAWTAFLLAIDLPAARALEPALPWSALARLWGLAVDSAPLGAVTGVLALTQSLPRYLLQLTHGAAAVGYYTALASLVPALSQLAAAVGHAAAPRLGWTASADRGSYRRLVLRLVAAAGATSLLLTFGAGTVAGRTFLRLAYAPDYAAYHASFVVIVLAAGFGVVNTVATFALLAARRLALQLWIQCLGLLVTGLAGAALIPRFAVSGGAVATALGGAVMAAVSAHVLMRGVAVR